MELGEAAPVRLEDLMDPPVIVRASARCDEVDDDVRGRWWRASSILVVDGERLGVVPRDDFLYAMSGRFGYGRALWLRRPVGELADWAPRCIPASASLTVAAGMLTGGSDAQAYRDLVVTDPVGRAVGVLRPAAVMQALAESFAQRAAHDALTGLANRAAFVAGLDDLMGSAVERDASVVLAFVDLDRLKEVNDTHGHAAGDALIRESGRRLRDLVSGVDGLVGRLGGDEFGVATVLEGPSGDTATAAGLAEAVHAALRAPGGPAAHPWLDARASVGAVLADSRACRVMTSADLLSGADAAMYRAKSAGGDRVEVAAARHGTVERGFALGVGPDGTVRAVPVDGSLEVCWQPIVSTVDGSLVGVEALLRHRRSDGTLDGPVVALERAQASGVAAELDLWVLDRALRELVHRDRAGVPGGPFVAVNLTRESVALPDLAGRVLAVVARRGLAASRLHVEIPETVTAEELRRAAPQIEALREAGVRVDLDDLGGLLSGVRHLSSDLLHGVKLDTWLVQGAAEDAACEELLALLVGLASARGLLITAEGVETSDQLELVTRLGVPRAQGFLLGRPAPPAEVAVRHPAAVAHRAPASRGTDASAAAPPGQ